VQLGQRLLQMVTWVDFSCAVLALEKWNLGVEYEK
jgi:hypothetical protein